MRKDRRPSLRRLIKVLDKRIKAKHKKINPSGRAELIARLEDISEGLR